jgi:hypothetical protein
MTAFRVPLSPAPPECLVAATSGPPAALGVVRRPPGRRSGTGGVRAVLTRCADEAAPVTWRVERVAR